MNQNLGQLFIIGLEGHELTSAEEDFIIKNNIGGVALYERNIESPRQLHRLCQHLQSLANQQADKAPIFIGTDMEGGRLATLPEPFTQWPSSLKVAETDSASTAFQMAQMMAAEMSSVGFNVNFAPCVDVLTNEKNDLIGDRSPGSTANVVEKVASAQIRGLIKGGVLPCAKHFPGHGNTIVDSHEDLPVDDISYDDLMEKLIPPFKKAFKSRLDLVMTAHVKYSQIDSDWPATLSEKILKDLLRSELRYRNLIIADDLLMQAMTKTYDKNTVVKQAIKAGCDLLMYCHATNTYQEPYEVLQQALANKEVDTLSVARSHELVLKIKKAKLGKSEPMSFEDAEKIIGCTEHKEVAEKVSRGEALEVPKE